PSRMCTNVQVRMSTGSSSTRKRRPEGKDRRLLLLDTTLEVIGREGVDAVSHRVIAQKADVPLGSTTYWFRSRDEMLTEALAHFARTETAMVSERLEEVASASRDGGTEAAVDAIAHLLAPQLGESRWRTVAQYALMGEAARRPELVPVVQE